MTHRAVIRLLCMLRLSSPRRHPSGGSSAWAAAALLAAVAGACGGATASGPAPSTSLASPPTASPSSRASPLPTSSPVAPSTPFPTSTPAVAWYPWLPAIDAAQAPTYVPDSFVVGLVDIVPVSPTPGGAPYRFDTGDPDPSTHPLMGFPRGGVLVVLHGPVVVDGVEWYLLTPAQLAIDVPTGWSPIEGPDGTPLIGPQTFDCPESPVTVERLSQDVLTDGLPACYGNNEIVLIGELSCTAEPDAFVVGASWLDGGMCRTGAPPTIYGLDPDLPSGRYRVTGRFLHPEAAACRSPDDVSALGRLVAVLHCRRAFVAASAQPA